MAHVYTFSCSICQAQMEIAIDNPEAIVRITCVSCSVLVFKNTNFSLDIPPKMTLAKKQKKQE